MMKSMLLASTVSLMLGIAPAVAQDKMPAEENMGAESAEQKMEPGTKTVQTTKEDGKSMTFIDKQAEDEWLATGYIGNSVENGEGETLGEIIDLTVGPEGKVSAAVISVGGFLGIGTRTVAVPVETIDSFEDENGAEHLRLTVSVDALENAPEFMTLAEQRAREDAAAQQKKLEQQQQQNSSGQTLQ